MSILSAELWDSAFPNGPHEIWRSGSCQLGNLLLNPGGKFTRHVMNHPQIITMFILLIYHEHITINHHDSDIVTINEPTSHDQLLVTIPWVPGRLRFPIKTKWSALTHDPVKTRKKKNIE